ncbi:GlxA family transcriptional regulator [Paracoccaceae bacterium]|nr:GlxA family transcriptional regulator [Paracoccaceae bacterium]
MDSTSKKNPYSIGLLLTEGFALMSYASLVEPIRAANLLAGKELYKITDIAVQSSRIKSSSGAIIPTKDATSDVFDLVLVITGGDPKKIESTALFDTLRRLSRSKTIVGGISGGPYLLAAAGLMHGYRMTVHWEHAPAMQERWPELLLERSLYIFDRKRVTCAGGTAPLDLMHSLITEHHGHSFARKVSDWFMHTDFRPAAGPQRAGLVERIGVTDQAILNAIEAMENHISDPLNLQDLSRIAQVGERQLNRLFKNKLNISTMGYYRGLRLDLAQNLLRNSSLSVTEISLATGFSGSAHFSSCYSQKFGDPPSSQRR